jgi:hypothetical protein
MMLVMGLSAILWIAQRNARFMARGVQAMVITLSFQFDGGFYNWFQRNALLLHYRIPIT